MTEAATINNQQLTQFEKLSKGLKAEVNNKSNKNALIALLPQNATNKEQMLTQICSTLLFEVQDSDQLQKCTANSLFNVLKGTLAQGLRLGKEYKEAYAIAGWSKALGGYKAQLRVGYQAYINKAYEDGILLDAITIIKQDIEKGWFHHDTLNDKMSLNRDLLEAEKIHTKDNIIYVVVKVEFPDGRKRFHLLSRDELEEKSYQYNYKTKERFIGEVWKSQIRSTDFQQMVKKAALIQIGSRLPSKSLRKLADFDYKQEAIIAEDMTDVTPKTANLDNMELPKSNSKAAQSEETNNTAEEPKLVPELEPKEVMNAIENANTLENMQIVLSSYPEMNWDCKKAWESKIAELEKKEKDDD